MMRQRTPRRLAATDCANSRWQSMKRSDRMKRLEVAQKLRKRDTAVRAVAFAVMPFRNHRAGQCNRSDESIARRAGCENRGTARPAFKRLREQGLVSHVESCGGNRQSTIRYRLAPRRATPGASKYSLVASRFNPGPSHTTDHEGITCAPRGLLEREPRAVRPPAFEAESLLLYRPPGVYQACAALPPPSCRGGVWQ
jgi:hypothetical protein